jgi:hypothetical protein
VFELNGDAKVTAFTDIKGRSAIIVDDFYRDPDEIRELALSLKYSDDPDLVAAHPGSRSYFATTEVREKLYNIYFDLCSNKLWKGKVQKTQLLEDGSFRIPLRNKIRPFNLEAFNSNWDIQGFMVNNLNDSSLRKNPTGIIPHQDYWENKPSSTARLQFGSVIFLNTPDECAGGTNLYSWKGEMSIPVDWQPEWMKGINNDDVPFEYIKDKMNGNNPYTVEFEADMVYNRMFLYQADVLHCQNSALGMFTDYNRINQILFM